MKSIFVLGIAVVDFVHLVEELPKGGYKFASLDAEVTGGGTGANAAVAISRLSGNAVMGTRLGNDLIGKIILDGLREEQVSLDYVRLTEHAKSSFSSVFVDKFGERQIVSYRGSGLDNTNSWLENLPKFDAFMADLRWPDGLESLVQQARNQDVPMVIDGEPAEITDSVWQSTHIAFSKPGIQHLTGEKDIVTAIRLLAGVRKNWICVTDGENGVFRSKSGKIDHIPSFKINAKNTLGAGDVWHGAFTLQLAEGADEDDAIVFANAAAAVKSTRIGSRSSFPSRDEVETFLTQHS